MNLRKAILALSLLATVTNVPLTSPQAVAQGPDCKVTLKWILVEYTAGNVGADAWRWRARGKVNNKSNGWITIPSLQDPPAFLAPLGSFDPSMDPTVENNGVLVGPDEIVGEAGEFLSINIKFEAKEIDPGTRHPNDFSTLGTINQSVQCVGMGSLELTGTVSITDAGGEDVGAPPPTPGAMATLTYKFKLEWNAAT